MGPFRRGIRAETPGARAVAGEVPPRVFTSEQTEAILERAGDSD